MIQIVLALENKSSAPTWMDRVPDDLYTKTTLTEEDYAEAYLKYIVAHYDTLQDYTLFLRSDPLKFCTAEPNRFIHALVKEPCLLFDRTYWLQNLKCLPNGVPHHPGLPVREWHQKLFPGVNPPQVFEFIAGSQFMVTKDKIKSRPKALYENILKNVQNKELDTHVLERMWLILFNMI